METKLIEQIIAEACNMHPLIQQCSAGFEDKLKLQFMLDTQYNGDISLLVGDFLRFLIENEEYELASVVRDEFLGKM